MQAVPSRPRERRIDPEDGQPRSFEELRSLCIGSYTEQEIAEYWATACRPLPDGAASVSSEQRGALIASPRLSDGPLRPLARPGEAQRDVQGAAVASALPRPAHAQERASLRPARLHELPVAAAEGGAADVQDDPFLISGDRAARDLGREVRDVRAAGLWRAPPEAASAAPSGCLEDLYELLGEGDRGRELSAQKVLVLVPWCLFSCSLVLWVLLRHCLRELCVAATTLACLASACLALAGRPGRRGGVPLRALGALCLAAAAAGAGAGELGHQRRWRQYWWLRTGRRFERTSAATPAASRLDAALLSFREGNGTLGGAAVDHARAAGHRSGRLFCAAPVLSPGAAASGLALVNYWAVGLDCCQALGSFTCDAARERAGGYGLVLLDAGFPCPGCNSASFRSAVEKAERVHGLVSAPDAILLRWVSDPAAAAANVFWEALFFLVVGLLVAFVAFWLLGSLAWYYGAGLGPGEAAGLWSAHRHKQAV